MGKLASKTVHKLASLSALGVGTLALTPNADANTILYDGPPITLTLGGTSTWNSNMVGSLALPGAVLGFSVFQCGCNYIKAAVMPNSNLFFSFTVLPIIHPTTSHPSSFFARLVGAGATQTRSGVSYGPVFASFLSSAGNLLSGGNGQFQNRFGLFSFAAAPGSYDFGWVELSLSASANPAATTQLTIENYAYDDTGAPIAAGYVPEPATLGPTGLAALALGAAGLRRWRAARKKVA